MIRAPPGSGYLGVEDDEVSVFPDTYEPMMEYPGTMRPGRTPENQPYSTLPIQETDPDPVPWPHFQEIEWHHNWGAPHEHPIPMEEFIEMNGRWATAEMEAEMRAGARRGVRERRELEESQKAASFILDDDEEDDEGDVEEETLDLGQGVDLLMSSGVETPPKPAVDTAVESDDNDDDDNFLLDLGLDTDEEDADEDGGEEPAFASSSDGAEGILEAMQSMIDAEETSDEPESDTPDINLDFDDLGLSFGEEDDAEDESDEDEEDFILMDDDDLGQEQEIVPLDDMIGNEDMGDDDDFDDGGFDFGD